MCDTESEYESESEYEETEIMYNDIGKFEYFANCTSCQQVKIRQQILLDKCDNLQSVKHIVTDFYGCDKCCKLRSLLDDYILPFTNSHKYPEYGEVHKIMQDDVQKDKYTLEVHLEMKATYENLDKFDFRRWHEKKMKHFEGTLCGYFNYYQMVYHMYLKITYLLAYDIRRDKILPPEYLKETSEFLNQMIVQKSK